MKKIKIGLPNETNDVKVKFEDMLHNSETVMQSVFDKIERKHACGYCPYTSNNKYHLKAHVENVHMKIRRHFCKQCNYASNKKDGLTNHIKVVHEKSKYVCEDCGYTIERKALLKSHKASAHGVSFDSKEYL